MAHEHSVYDTDPHFLIDENTREITLASGELPVIVQHDHNSERFSFELPKLVDGHDMTQCNEVEVHYLNIDAQTKDTAKGVYPVDDLHEDGDKAVCSWLVSSNATQYAGKLNFMLRFKCTVDGVITYAWNSAIYKDVTVSSGMDNSEEAIGDYSDVLSQWKNELEQTVETALNEAIEEAKASGDFKGEKGCFGFAVLSRHTTRIRHHPFFQ